MTVRDLLAPSSVSPKAQLLALEPGCEQYHELEIDEVMWQGGRLDQHLGAERDNMARR
jgi:hypothetical protein